MLRMPIPARDVKRESNSGALHIHARGRSLSLSRYSYGGLAKCNLDAVTQIATGYSTTTFQFDQVETTACAVLSKFHLVDPDPARAGVLI
jgi:hypothetical protein